MAIQHIRIKSILFLYLFVCFIVIGSPLTYADQPLPQQDYDRPLDLQTCATFYQQYEPAFYTGFAPRSRDPKRLHIHVGRGNQLRVTLVLSDEVLEAYVRDMRARYTTYRTMVDNGTLQLTQNSAFEEFEETVKEIEELHGVEPDKTGQDIIIHNLQLMTDLNPGRIFHIKTPVKAVIQHWLDFLEPTDFEKIDQKRSLAIINEMLPTRLWLTSLTQETSNQLDDLIKLAAETGKVCGRLWQLW